MNADLLCFVITYFISTGVDSVIMATNFVLYGYRIVYTFIVKAGEVDCNSYLFIAFEYPLFFMAPE